MLSDEELLEELLPILEIDLQISRAFTEQDEDGIAQFRRIGRKAARVLGYHVHTSQSDPRLRSDRRVVVVVLLIPEPGSADENRLAERGRLIINNIKW